MFKSPRKAWNKPSLIQTEVKLWFDWIHRKNESTNQVYRMLDHTDRHILRMSKVQNLKPGTRRRLLSAVSSEIDPFLVCLSKDWSGFVIENNKWTHHSGNFSVSETWKLYFPSSWAMNHCSNNEPCYFGVWPYIFCKKTCNCYTVYIRSR